LAVLSGDFAALYSGKGRPSTPTEMLLRAMLLQVFYSIRSERQLMERLDHYAYVRDNPLKYTDPTGYCFMGCFWKAVEKPITSFIRNTPIVQTGIQIVAAYYGPWASAIASVALSYNNTGSLGNAVKAGAIAYVTANAYHQVGIEMNGDFGGKFGYSPSGSPLNALRKTASDWIGSSQYFANVAGHAAVGCVSSTASGGSCGSGALAAGFSGAIGPILVSYGTAGVIGASVTGGIGSVLGGGKFANGAVTGAFGYLFNEMGNDIQRGYSSDRAVTLGEADMLRSEFPNIDVGSIRITYDQSGGAAYTPSDTLHFPETAFGCQDFSSCGDGMFGWFVHEGTHAWQSQNGVSPTLGHIFSGDVLTFGNYMSKQQYSQTPSPGGLSTEKEADWHKWHYLCGKASGC
jgi:hypothetical protein